jgi:LPS-assembly protein
MNKVLNLSYRGFHDSLTVGNPNAINQYGIAGQWPLGGGWSVVGRYDYSVRDKRSVETVAGVEYNESCWAFRVVTQRLLTAVATANSAIFFQLELNGFSRIGSSPLEVLKRSVPGYNRPVSPLSDTPVSE